MKINTHHLTCHLIIGKYCTASVCDIIYINKKKTTEKKKQEIMI